MNTFEYGRIPYEYSEEMNGSTVQIDNIPFGWLTNRCQLLEIGYLDIDIIKK